MGCIRKVGQTHELCLSSGLALWRFHSHLKQSRVEVGLSNSQNVAHKLDPGIKACRQQGHPLFSSLHFAANREMGATPIEPGATSHHIRPAVGGVMLVAQVRECVDLIDRWWHANSRFVQDHSFMVDILSVYNLGR